VPGVIDLVYLSKRVKVGSEGDDARVRSLGVPGGDGVRKGPPFLSKVPIGYNVGWCYVRPGKCRGQPCQHMPGTWAIEVACHRVEGA